jgi:citrate synthase
MITKAVLKDILQPINPKWKTSITKVQPNNLTTRGYSQEDLIGNISFTEMVYLLLKGELPSKNDSKMLQAVLVSFCDHGVTPPSTQAARIMASAGSPIPACLGGGILAFGENHAGAIENAMKIFQEGLNYNESSDFCTVDVASKIIDDFLDNDKKVPGFGHRYHDEDPRARKLIELAKGYDNYNYHLKLALCMEELLYARKGIKLNIDGANAAILSDLGFDWKTGSGFFIIGRLPGILAHVSEEKNEKPFQQYFI